MSQATTQNPAHPFGKSAVVVGVQWGDEGKGRIVDTLSAEADVVARFHGGNNAGHTLVVDGVRTVLHIVPSGIMHERTTCVIGNGVVIDPENLLQELEMLQIKKLLRDEAKLRISSQAHVILPFHKRIDKAREHAAGAGRIGTTGRGIGPCYEDKVARRGLRMIDLVNPDRIAGAVRTGVMYANSLLEAIGGDTYQGVEIEEMIERLRSHGKRLKPYVDDVGLLIDRAWRQGKNVLFEGAQGTLLDVDHGTYPYVTSSNCVASNAASGTGVGPHVLGRVVAVSKAYTTRVGEGPFPTEYAPDEAQVLRAAGGEFGATTGRPRRCGALDLVALRYALRLNGATDLCLTKLDVLGGLGDIRVCVAYDIDGQRVEDFPLDTHAIARAKPIYEVKAGFPAFESAAALPENAQKYVDFIASSLDVRLSMVCAGPGRGQEVVLHHPLRG